MRQQTFCLRQRFDDRRDPFQAGPRKFLHADHLYEVENTEATAQPGGAASRQDVIGSRSVVTGSLRRIVADKYGTSTANESKIATINGDVFGSDRVGPVETFAARGRDKDQTATTERFT